MTRPLIAAALLIAACSKSSPINDAGVDFASGPDLADFDAAPGKVGSKCDPYGAAHPCDSGLRCTIGVKGGKVADVCVPESATPIAEGQVCTAIDLGMGLSGDACQSGHACVAYAGVSRCLRLCSRHVDCATTEACGAPTGAPPSADGIVLAGCITPDACDAITQTGCPALLACYLGSDDTTRFFTCDAPASGGGAALDSACTKNSDCAPHLICASLGFCRTLCYLTPPSGASAGLCSASEVSCMRISGAPANYGVCDAP